MRVAISGRVFVLGADGETTDPAVLRRFDGIVYEDEAFTEYLGGPEEENILLAALQPGGYLRLVYKPALNQLWGLTEYTLTRPLSARERDLLVAYTIGQWSDGIGENFHSRSQERYGLVVDCFRRTPEYDPRRPLVEIC